MAKRQSGRGQSGRDDWWSVRVELLGGASGELWPTPGRIFAVSPRHTFHVFAEAIDDAFARWDRSHLHEFEIPRLGKTVTEFRFSRGRKTRSRTLSPTWSRSATCSSWARSSSTPSTSATTGGTAASWPRRRSIRTKSWA